MRKKIFLVLGSIIMLSCNKTADKKTIEPLPADSISADKDVSEPKFKIWYDPIVADYIKNSNNELIRAHIKNNDNIQWILDDTEKTDSAYYYIFNIGQDVTDENNTNPRFSSDGWIYIDSLSKKVYEYDLPNDKLVLWEK